MSFLGLGPVAASGSSTFVQDLSGCPYCHGPLNAGALSCRSCGRDLTPVLPLLSRIVSLESRVAKLEALARTQAALPAPSSSAADGDASASAAAPVTGRRYWILAAGFVALLIVYWAVVIWLDLALAYLRLASILIPLSAGAGYIGVRPRLAWSDVAATVLFAVAAVAAMNAWLGWIDGVPIAPQGAAAWRETLFYALSICASMFSGLLLGVLRAALHVRGLASFPRLQERLVGGERKAPLDTLKAVELTILTVSAIISAVTGLAAGFLGLIR